MEILFHLVNDWYMPYAEELTLALLVCTLLLMICALFAVRRCRRQIRDLTEKTKEMTKLALSQSSRNALREKPQTRVISESGENGVPGAAQKNEEIFGSVIQEIFP